MFFDMFVSLIQRSQTGGEADFVFANVRSQVEKCIFALDGVAQKDAIDSTSSCVDDGVVEFGHHAVAIGKFF